MTTRDNEQICREVTTRWIKRSVAIERPTKEAPSRCSKLRKRFSRVNFLSTDSFKRALASKRDDDKDGDEGEDIRIEASLLNEVKKAREWILLIDRK